MSEDKLSYELNQSKKRLEVSGDENKFGKIIKKFEGCRKNNQKRNSWIITNLKLEDSLKKFIDTINFGSLEPTLEIKEIKEINKKDDESDDESDDDSDESDSDESESDDESDVDKNNEEVSKKFTPVKASKKNITPPPNPPKKIQKPKDNSPPPKKIQKPRDDSPPPKKIVSKVSNSPISRKQLFHKKMSPEYSTHYSSDKISYYKSLGKKHISDVDDSSTDYSSSESDDFPSPEPIKKRNGKRLDDEEDIEVLKKKIYELERKKR